MQSIDDRKRIELVIPDDIVSLFQRCAVGGNDQALARRHKVGNALGRIHAGNAVIAAGDDAEQLAMRGAVFGDGHRRVAVRLVKRDHIGERIGGREVDI